MVLFSAGTAAFSWYLNAPSTSLGPDVVAALVLGVSAVAFSPLGVKLSVKLSGKVVGRAMGMFMCLVGAFSAYVLYSEETGGKPARVAAKMADTPEKIVMLAGLGMMTGLLGGLFGIGGGFILVPVLVKTALKSPFSLLFDKSLKESIDGQCHGNGDESGCDSCPKYE